MFAFCLTSLDSNETTGNQGNRGCSTTTQQTKTDAKCNNRQWLRTAHGASAECNQCGNRALLLQHKRVHPIDSPQVSGHEHFSQGKVQRQPSLAALRELKLGLRCITHLLDHLDTRFMCDPRHHADCIGWRWLLNATQREMRQAFVPNQGV